MDKIIYAELDCIFNQLNSKDLLKVPKEVIRYFSENKDENYNCSIDLHIPLEEQHLHLETIRYLCAINYLYLSDEDEREELRKIYEENDKIFAKKTDIEKLFEKRKMQKVQTYSNLNSEEALTIYKKESFIKIILRRIKNFFKHY